VTQSGTTAGVGRRRLFDRDFSYWYLARSISVAGTAASAVALPLLVYRTTASPALTAAVVGLEAAPYLMFGLFAGAAADRLSRKRMMIVADVGCAVMLATVPIAALFHSLASWHVLIVAFGVGFGFCWFDAAAWGAFVRLVGKPGVTRANSGVLGLLVVHADQALGLSPQDRRLGLLYAAGAVGSLIAAVLLPRASRRAGQGTVSIAGLTIFVLALLGLAYTSTFTLALAAWALWAVARLAVNANGITVRQLLTPDDLQGRVNTTGRMLAWGGTPFGALVGGLTANAYGVRVAYLALAVPAALSLCLVLASPVRGLRLVVE
jgi:MFS family permease